MLYSKRKMRRRGTIFARQRILDSGFAGYKRVTCKKYDFCIDICTKISDNEMELFITQDLSLIHILYFDYTHFSGFCTEFCVHEMMRNRCDFVACFWKSPPRCKKQCETGILPKRSFLKGLEK